MVVCHVSRLYTPLRRWKFWTVVWENTSGVHFRVVWKNTAHVQGIRFSPKGSHLIPWTIAVFSNTALKWTPFAYYMFVLLVRAHLSKRGILKVCKAFLSRICHAVVFTQFGYADSKSGPCQALFLVFPFQNYKTKWPPKKQIKSQLSWLYILSGCTADTQTWLSCSK